MCLFTALFQPCAWWRHRMGTFSALLALCSRNSPVTGEFPAQRPVIRSFDVFFLNQQLSKRWTRRWFESPLPSLWRHCYTYQLGTFSHMLLRLSFQSAMPSQTASALNLVRASKSYSRSPKLRHSQSWLSSAFGISSKVCFKMGRLY